MVKQLPEKAATQIEGLFPSAQLISRLLVSHKHDACLIQIDNEELKQCVYILATRGLLVQKILAICRK